MEREARNHSIQLVLSTECQVATANREGFQIRVIIPDSLFIIKILSSIAVHDVDTFPVILIFKGTIR